MKIFNYDKATHVNIPCNLCNSRGFSILSREDRYGLPEQSVICHCCGLIYINPRISVQGYNDFYETGFYRQLVPVHQKKQNKVFSPKEVFLEEKRFGEALVLRIKKYLNERLIIEVGSATGGILASFQKELGSRVLGIEPSAAESEYATSQGIPTIKGLFEEIKIESDKPGNILCVQALNHLLDPKKFLTWAHETLDTEGRLILVVQNFLTLAKKLGRLKYATQIDHVYMFTPISLNNFVRSAGFEIILFEDWNNDSFTRLGLSSHHMCIVARKVETVKPFEKLFISNDSFKKTKKDLLRTYLLMLIFPFAQTYRTLKKKFVVSISGFKNFFKC